MVGEHVRYEENFSLSARWGHRVARPDPPPLTRHKDASPEDLGQTPDVMPPPSQPHLPALTRSGAESRLLRFGS